MRLCTRYPFWTHSEPTERIVNDQTVNIAVQNDVSSMLRAYREEV